MLRPNRKRFRTDIVPSDMELWAIGMIVVQWGQLEAWIDLFMDKIFGASYSSVPPLPFKDKLKEWKRITIERVPEPQQSQLLSIIQNVGEVQAHRDKVVHGQWGSQWKQAESASSGEIATVGRDFGPRRHFHWKLNYAGLINIADQIDGLSWRLQTFLIAEVGPGKPIAATLRERWKARGSGAQRSPD